MSNRIKNLVKENVKILLEIKVSDLPQKQVVNDKSAHDAGVASFTIDNIVSKFRELGIDVPLDELATVELLKSKSPFNMSFKLLKSTRFFDGKKEVKGKAKVDGKKSVGGKLTLYFISDDGDKVAIVFDPEGLKSARPETGQPMVIVQEKIKYNVKLYGSKDLDFDGGLIKQGEVNIILPGGKSKSVKPHQVGKLYKITSKSGKDYLVSPNPIKQKDVEDGFVNVTIVKGGQLNKSFVVPKNKLTSPDPTYRVYFSDDVSQPQIVNKGDSNQMVENVIIITSLPDFNDDKQNDSGDNLRFTKNKPIPVEVVLRVDEPRKLNSLNLGTLGNLNVKLKNSKAFWAQSTGQDMVLKLVLDDGTVVMLKPQNLYPNPEFLGNWNDLSIQIGRLAGNDENWSDDVMGTASIRLKK